MILEKTFYAVKCDNCGVIHKTDDIEYWESAESAWGWADPSGWALINDDTQYCPDCYSYGDDDELIIDLTRRKTIEK